MPLLVMIMLGVQAAILLVMIFGVGFRPANPAPVWPSYAISLVIIAGASWEIAADHPGDVGAAVLRFGAPLLLGMAILCLLLYLRQRRKPKSG